MDLGSGGVEVLVDVQDRERIGSVPPAAETGSPRRVQRAGPAGVGDAEPGMAVGEADSGDGGGQGWMRRRSNMVRTALRTSALSPVRPSCKRDSPPRAGASRRTTAGIRSTRR